MTKLPQGTRLPPQSFFLLTTGGVALITSIRLTGHPLGFVFAFGNCVLFMVYVMLGHRMANAGGGIDRLAASMLIALIVATRSGWAARCPRRAPQREDLTTWITYG